jgi:hypothetical protein
VTDDLACKLGGLETFLLEVLREVHPEWEGESLDGILPIIARKTGPREAEILGHCILITDQTVVPFHLRLQVDADQDEICWLELRLGKAENGKMVRTPYDGNWKNKHLQSVPEQSNRTWAYAVTFGQKQYAAAAL